LYKQNPRLLEVRDGDGDGKIYDGKPSEAPAEKKPKAAQPKSKSKAQKFAVADYSGDRFLKLNKALRTGESLDSSDQTLVRNLDAHLASSPKHKGVTFRVIEDPDGAIAKTIQDGGSFTDKAFASTSTSIPSFVSKGQIAFQVVGKNGVDISSDSLNPGEKEVLFPRNTRFKVVKTKTNEYGALVAILQEIEGQAESLDPDLYNTFERLIEAKDGDGDGLIDDGKPTQRASPPKQPKAKAAKGKPVAKPKAPKPTDDEKIQAFEKLIAAKSDEDKAAFRKSKADGVSIPIAWTEVAYYGKDADIIAEGRDSKGRKQRAERPDYRQGLSDQNNARIAKELTPKMDAIRKQLREDAIDGNEESKVLYLIAMTGFRIGGKGDGKAETEAFGASTLRGEHVKVKGDTVTFDFPGKKGVQQQHSLKDSVVAGWFGGVKPEENLFKTRDVKVREAWQEKYGGVKVHDIRHAVASELAKANLAKLIPPKPKNKKESDALKTKVGTIVGEKLGNNPSQAIGTYIDPSLWKVLQVA
jgi:DNA topoisomerase-1